MMQIRNFEPMPTRPCQYCLALQDDSVFSDFDVDQDGCLYLVRISFDGYGCLEIDSKTEIGKIDSENSKNLVGLIKENKLETPEASRILKEYFYKNRELLWEDALEDHCLI
jgi:hypothetical protein